MAKIHQGMVSSLEPDTSASTKSRGAFVFPSGEMIARFVGGALGGAVLGSSFAPVPLAGAFIGALAGAGIVAFHARHAY